MIIRCLATKQYKKYFYFMKNVLKNAIRLLKNLNETFVADIFVFFVVFTFLSIFTSGKEIVTQHKEDKSKASAMPMVVDLGTLANEAVDNMKTSDNYTYLDCNENDFDDDALHKLDSMIECDSKPDQVCV